MRGGYGMLHSIALYFLWVLKCPMCNVQCPMCATSSWREIICKLVVVLHHKYFWGMELDDKLKVNGKFNAGSYKY